MKRVAKRNPRRLEPYKLNKVLWCKPTVFPAWVGFCPSEKAWRQFHKEYNVQPAEPFPSAAGNTFPFYREGKKVQLLILVTINKKYDDVSSWESLIALVAHEAMHCVRAVLDDAGEKHPGHETEAYLMQNLLGDLLHAYKRTRRPRALRFGGSR